jgi:replicative DNA helicase
MELLLTDMPYSGMAEQAVLGSILQDGRLIERVIERLRPDHFREEINGALYLIMTLKFTSGDLIDPVTVVDASIRREVFRDEPSAAQYLAKLIECAVTPDSVVTYAKIIEDKALQRKLMHASAEIYDIVRAGTEDAAQMLEIAESKIYEIRGDKESGGLISLKPAIIDVISELSVLSENPDALAEKSYASGFLGLDRYIHGLTPSNLILVAGRPSLGKSTFAINIAVNIAKRYPAKKVAVFSLEMSREEIAKRILAAEARVTNDKLKTGQLQPEDWTRIGEAADILTRLEFYVDDKVNVTVQEMKAKLRREKNIAAVVVDYLQLMTAGRRIDNRATEVSEITRNLKIMAKELNVPLIVAAQLNRESEKRQDKRPGLSDLRESGSIEQDADTVLMLYRDTSNPDNPYPNQTECIIAKNRHGMTGTVMLNLEGEYSRFTELDFVHEGAGAGYGAYGGRQ